MKNKGFTLLELLAVIVILAIIALIATPIILHIINDAKIEATKRSAENYLKAVEFAVANEQLKDSNFKLEDGTYYVTIEGNFCVGSFVNNICKGKTLKVEVDGQKPSGYKIVIEDKKIVNAILEFENATIEKTADGKLKEVETDKDKYEKAKNNGSFSGVYDQYVIENVYNAKLGAKVNYEEPAALGYDGEWVILGVDNDQIVLVSTKTVGQLTLAGRDGRLNGIKKLDEFSSPYANGTTGVSARSINEGDLNSLLGYDPANELDGNPYRYGGAQEYGVTVSYKKVAENTFDVTKVKLDGTSETTTVAFEKGGGRTGEFLDINSTTPLALNESITMNFANNYYQYAMSYNAQDDAHDAGNDYFVYVMNPTYNPDRTGYLEIFTTITPGKYWIADTCDLAHDSGSGWGMRFMNVMNKWANISKETLYHSSKDGDTANGLGAGEFSATYGVRPVVYLNSNVKLTDTNSDGVYEITQN